MSQDWTDDCFAAGHAAQEDLQNIEDNFACLKSLFSGASAPSGPVAGLLWLDTTNHLLMVRNEANNAWLTLYDLGNQQAINCSRQVIAGTGLSGGGALTADRTVGISAGGVGATQLADGGVSSAKLAVYTAGDRLLIEGSTDATTGSNAKLGEVQLDKGGTLRIKFTMSAYGTSGATVGRVYRNGSAVGTNRTLNATSPTAAQQTYSEDISGWSAGDKVQIYGYTTATAGGVAGFEISSGNWYSLMDLNA